MGLALPACNTIQKDLSENERMSRLRVRSLAIGGNFSEKCKCLCQHCDDDLILTSPQHCIMLRNDHIPMLNTSHGQRTQSHVDMKGTHCCVAELSSLRVFNIWHLSKASACCYLTIIAASAVGRYRSLHNSLHSLQKLWQRSQWSCLGLQLTASAAVGC